MDNPELLKILERIAVSLERLSLNGLDPKDKSYVIRRKLTSKIKERVKERDGFKCVRCGFPEKLTIHHVIPISEAQNHDLEELINEENLVTLCERCHKKIHEAKELEKNRFIKHIKSKKKIIPKSQNPL